MISRKLRILYKLLTAFFFLTLLLLFWEPHAQTAPLLVYVQQYGAVGDGVTDDTGAIQAALSATGDKPSIVVFEANKTYLMQRNVYLYSNTTINLNGATLCDGYAGGVTDEYVEWANGLRFLNHPHSANISGYGALHNVRITNGVIDGSCGSIISGVTFAFLHASDITFDNLEFRDCMAGTHIIDLGGCKNVTIHNCHFTGTYIANPAFQYREMIQIDSALYKGMPYWDESGGAAYDGLPCENIVISDCTFEQGQGTYAPNAIGTHTSYSKASRNITIQGNTFYDCYSYAIRFPKVKNLTITKNQFVSMGAQHAKSACFIYVSKKSQTGSSATACKNIKIQDNRFLGKKKKCIIPVKITGFPKLPFSHITIQGNQLSGTYKSRKSRFLWQCTNVKDCKIQ
ncbi:MAG: right-handed parallel beta-helix repeat-containing protein [Lachnospiraceae bacterium]|nr:right-handed parallel beta-helix repeat-containing protein [Lachnospiraceae bacterium]